MNSTATSTEPATARRARASNGRDVRAFNLQSALNLLRHGEPMDSPRIGEALGVHASTVTRLLGTLQAAGLVHSLDPEASATVGRPPRVWALNAEAGYALGLAIHPITLRAVLTDLTGRSLASRAFSYDPPLTTRDLPAAVSALVASVVGDVDPARILGLGAGVSGVVSGQNGALRISGGLFTEDGHYATDYPLGEELRRIFPWPVSVANDANVGALAVFQQLSREGSVTPDGTLLYVMAAENLWGFGTGIIVAGRLYEGAHGAAGETLHPHMFATDPAWGDLPRRALAGDEEAVGRVLAHLEPVLEHLTALALFMDTHRVVIGGAFAGIGQPLLRALTDMIRATPGFGQHISELPEQGLVLDPLRPNTVAIGAAELVLDRLFCAPLLGEPGPLVRIALRH